MNGDHEHEPEDLIAAAIEAAEEIRDPLDGLVEKTATDPGAAVHARGARAARGPEEEDRAAFEALRSNLKKAGCRVTALDEAIARKAAARAGAVRRRLTS